MQYDHGRDTRVGSVPIGVYEEIREDEHGLFVRGRIFDNDLAEPIRQAIEAGAIRGMSIKFAVVTDEWRDGTGRLLRPHEVDRLRFDPGSRGPLRRTVKEIRLHEAGPVSTPAYETTSVGVRDIDRRNTIPADVRIRLLKLKGQH
ncbi:HK97 family phage prohead protease [Rhodococcus sp. AG1013]|nr:HK97 family phage prohead protease [Rhodococcus sp. AG1013]